MAFVIYIVLTIMATITGTYNFSAIIPTLTGTNILSIVARPAAGAPATQRFAVTTTGSTAISLIYDANGNTLTDEAGNTYAWNALNQVTKVTFPDTSYQTFSYDALGRNAQILAYDSTSVHTLTSTKNYLWSGGSLLEERDASNAVTKRFFSQGEQQTLSGTATPFYYARDQEGSITEMSSAAGALVSRLSYDPFGNTSTVSGSLLSTFQYRGEMAAFNHRLLMGFNIYDSNTGTVLGDTKGAGGGGSNNPVVTPNLKYRGQNLKYRGQASLIFNLEI